MGPTCPLDHSPGFPAKRIQAWITGSSWLLLSWTPRSSSWAYKAAVPARGLKQTPGGEWQSYFFTDQWPMLGPPGRTWLNLGAH